jgi:amino acid adenylation domain-containing protein
MTSNPVPTQEMSLGSLSNDKQELIKLLLEQSGRIPEIKAFPRPEQGGVSRFPASRAQQRLWFIDRLEGGSVGYRISVAIRLLGTLNLEWLQESLDCIVQRHEVLRTVFVSDDSDPLQQIAAEASFSLRVIDLAQYERAQAEKQICLHKIEEAQAHFDLRKGPLIRGRLLRLAAQEHVLLVTMHHIVSDGWSMNIFVRELSELYSAHREGRSHRLEPMPIQYADYAQWQRELLSGEPLEKQLGYWRMRLAGIAPQVNLPTDRPRPESQTYRGGNVPVALGPQLSSKLRAFSQHHGVTLFMTLYAGWAVLLSRLSGEQEIVIGTPIANRQRAELEALIGIFVNTLVLRIELRDDLRVDELIAQVKELTLEAYDHQDVPFEQIVEALQPQRSLSRNPLFQVMFGLHNVPRTDPEFSGLISTLEDGVDEPSVFDLFLSMEERGEEVAGTLNFAMDLFDRETVDRWVRCYIRLLSEIAEHDHIRIGDLPILPDVERRQIIESFNATEAPYPQEKLVQELFEEQVERTPQAQAAVYEGQCVTYAELNRRANQLARYLKDKGIGPDQLVGICVERSVEMIVGVLGILKAGAAYLPLDPNYPAERLAFMLEDAAPRIILTKKELQAELSATQAEVLVLETKSKETVGYAEANLPAAELGLSAEKLVYVIYTSGSTGRPKGTAMAHHSMVNLIEWHRKTLSAEGRRVLQFAALSFDVAFQEIFSTLCTGGTLVLLDEWVRRDAGALAEFLNRNSVQTLFVPPLMLQSLAEYCQTACTVPTSLLDVITAGEQLRISPEIMGFFERLPGCRLHNHYGPTESHVVTALTLSGNPGEWPTLPAIGRPISNIQIYVLDRRRQPVPVGVAGEIYIGGAGVARGYLGRPDLTQERFIVDPFSAKGPARLYKTGDLGRWRADGTLEYLGRNDNQVKIRGFRIELGEIEVQLMRHKEVKEAAVVLREDIPGEKRLVAYVTSRDESSVSVEELRAHLAAALPDHMVPGAIVSLEHLPLTPSGKLDRRALPAPASEAYASQEYEAPQGAIEEAIAGIWQKLLRVERVGRRDNFFDLGGHSLLATRVSTHIGAELDMDIPLRLMFERPTVEELGAWIVQEIAAEVPTEES